MEEIKNPLLYFESLILTNQESVKKKFIHEAIENIGHVLDVNEEEGTILYWSSFYNDDINETVEGEFTYSFSRDFSNEFYRQAKHCQKLIQSTILEISTSGNSPKFYIETISKRLLQLNLIAKSNFKDFPTLEYSLSQIYQNINIKASITYNPVIEESYIERVSLAVNFSEDSYQWDSLNDENKIPQIKKLYELLIIPPAIISADEEDFINAFTKSKVSAGISWLLVGRNKLYSKVSIFYFVYKLKDAGYIEDFNQYDFGKKIEYVFRDNNGQVICSTKQSLAEFRKTLTTEHYERIDNIISQIII